MLTVCCLLAAGADKELPAPPVKEASEVSDIQALVLENIDLKQNLLESQKMVLIREICEANKVPAAECGGVDIRAKKIIRKEKKQ